MESEIREGENPVHESGCTLKRHPSSIEHVELGMNRGGPPPKTKYSLATDSERSSANEK